MTFRIANATSLGIGATASLYRYSGPVVTPPFGTPLETAVVQADGSLSFTTVSPDADYVAAAGGRYISFHTPGVSRPGSGHAVEDEAVILTDRGGLNFVGDAVTVTDDPSNDRSTVTVRAAPVFNVKDYGAKGDGTTDDTAAIQAAITEAAGKTLFFPAGLTYNVASSVTGLSSVKYVSAVGCTFTGAGAASLTTRQDRAIFQQKGLDDFTTTGASGFYWLEDLNDAALQFDITHGENNAGVATAFRVFGAKTKKTGRGTLDMFYGSCDFYGTGTDEAGLFIGSITGRGTGQGNLWGGHFVLDANQSYFGNAYGLVIQIWPPSGAKATTGGPNNSETCQAYGIQIFNPSVSNLGTKAIVVKGDGLWLSAFDAGLCPVERVSQLLLGDNYTRFRSEGAANIVAELGDGTVRVPVRRLEPTGEAGASGAGLTLTGAFQDIAGATLNVRPPIAGTLIVRATFDFNVTVGAVGLQCVGRCLYDTAGLTGSAIFQPPDSVKGRATVIQTWTIAVAASPGADKVLKLQAEALNLGAGAAAAVQVNTKLSYQFIPNT